MCAICGWISEKENLLNKQELFKEMLELMSCRGKDNTGYYLSENILLGHKKFEITDIENQPIYYNEYVIIYNGQIYNAEELKEELKEKEYKFDSNCDAEVILKGYVEFKESIFDRLDGVFALCIYNKKKKEILLVRDKLGVKPLYYAYKDNNFVFASNIKAILKSKIVKAYLSKEALGEILALRTI